MPQSFTPQNAPVVPASQPTAPAGQTIQAKDGTQLDASVVNLARAIRTQESGNDYTKSGDAGTSLGAYQFNNGNAPVPKGGVPANFQTWAKQYGMDPSDFSPINQDKVAYARLKDLKDQGLTPAQAAAVWNGGMGVKDNWQDHKGTVTINGKQISYDTPAYVDKVINTFKAIKSGQGPVGADQTTNGTMQPATGAFSPNTQGSSPSMIGGIASTIGQGAFSLFKGATSPLVTMLARPLQAAAEIAGASPEQVNAFSAKVPIYGENGALNVPQNAGDILKDVGRGVETAALGLAPVAGGAAFGFGSSLEQGNSPISLNTAAQTALGAAGGKVLDVASPYIAKGISAITPNVVKNAFGAVAEKATPALESVGNFMDNTKILPDSISSAINKGADFVNNAPGGAFNAIRRQYGSGVGGTPEEIRQATLNDVTKALGSTGQKSAGVMTGQNEKMLKGLETLHDLSPGLKVKDEFGDLIPYEPTTATLPQHVQALDAAKQQVYGQLDKEIAGATKGKVQVDMEPTVAYLNGILNSPGKVAQHARASQLLAHIKKLRTPTEVNEFLQDLNVGLKGLFSSGQASIERQVDAGATRTLNDSLDKTVINIDNGAKPIRQLKTQY